MQEDTPTLENSIKKLEKEGLQEKKPEKEIVNICHENFEKTLSI